MDLELTHSRRTVRQDRPIRVDLKRHTAAEKSEPCNGSQDPVCMQQQQQQQQNWSGSACQKRMLQDAELHMNNVGAQL